MRLLTPREKAAATRHKRAGGSEAELQSLCEQYLTLRQIPFLHIPAMTLNAAFHRRQMSGAELGAARAASEYLAGFPDICCFYRGRYFAFELKSAKGVFTHNQRKWQRDILVTEIRDFETFKMLLDKWCKEVDEWILKLKATP